MIRKERSRSRLMSGVRIHKRKNNDIRKYNKKRNISSDISLDNSDNKSNESNNIHQIKISRKSYTISVKIKALQMLKEYKNGKKKV